jgi:hypothetical protein
MRSPTGFVAAVAFAAAGCGFAPSGNDDMPADADADAGDPVDASGDDAAPDPDAADVDAPAVDGAVDARIDATPDAAPVVSVLCDASNAALRACFAFTGGTVTNGAGTSLSISSQNVGATAGPVGGAIALTATSVIHIAESAALELPGPYTFEAFVRLGAAPSAAGRAGIYDENGEWGIFINDQRQVYCTNGPVVGPALVLNTWTHVACVYDRQHVILYVGGQLVAMTPMTGDLVLTTADGGNLGQDCRAGGTSGDPMTGALDEVRIWASARSASQIAAAAARATP